MVLWQFSNPRYNTKAVLSKPVTSPLHSCGIRDFPNRGQGVPWLEIRLVLFPRAMAIYPVPMALGNRLHQQLEVRRRTCTVADMQVGQFYTEVDFPFDFNTSASTLMNPNNLHLVLTKLPSISCAVFIGGLYSHVSCESFSRADKSRDIPKS